MSNGFYEKLLQRLRDSTTQTFDLTQIGTYRLEILTALSQYEQQKSTLESFVKSLKSTESTEIYNNKLTIINKNIIIQQQLADTMSSIQGDGVKEISAYIQGLKTRKDIIKNKFLNLAIPQKEVLQKGFENLKETFKEDDQLVTVAANDLQKAHDAVDKAALPDRIKDMLNGYENLIQKREAQYRKEGKDENKELLTSAQRYERIRILLTSPFNYRNATLIKSINDFLQANFPNQDIITFNEVCLNPSAVPVEPQKKKEGQKRQKFVKYFFNLMAEGWGPIILATPEKKKPNIKLIQDLIKNKNKFSEDTAVEEDTEWLESMFVEIWQGAAISAARIASINRFYKTISLLPKNLDFTKLDEIKQSRADILEEVKATSPNTIESTVDKVNELHTNYETKVEDAIEKLISYTQKYIVFRNKNDFAEAMLSQSFMSFIVFWVILLDYTKGVANKLNGAQDMLISIALKMLIENMYNQKGSDLGESDYYKVYNHVQVIRLLEHVTGSTKDSLEESASKEDGDRDQIEQELKVLEVHAEAGEGLYILYNYLGGLANLEYYTSLLLDKNVIEQYKEDQRQAIGDAYFANIAWDTVPYDDPIILQGDSFVLKKTKKDYAMEMNFKDVSGYKGVIRITEFDNFVKDDMALHLNKIVKNSTYREAKLQDINFRFSNSDNFCAIDHFHNNMNFFIHNDGTLSLNGYNDTSLHFILGSEVYHALRSYVFRYILDCTQVVDKRGIKTPQTLLASFHEVRTGPYHIDPRAIYDDFHNITGLTKIVNHRDSHRRLLNENMLPGIKGFNNAKEYKLTLYAYVFNRVDDPLIADPLHTERMDDISEYEAFVSKCKALQKKYNTENTVIRFETGIKEFNKDESSIRRLKVNVIGDEDGSGGDVVKDIK